LDRDSVRHGRIYRLRRTFLVLGTLPILRTLRLKRG
jgi:hypothetical protein